jgi:hypothetical protein
MQNDIQHTMSLMAAQLALQLPQLPLGFEHAQPPQTTLLQVPLSQLLRLLQLLQHA